MEQFDKKLDIYSNNFTKEQLQEYEDAIFTKKIDKRKRAELELERLKLELSQKEDSYAAYFDELVRMANLLKVSNFDVTVLDEIYSTILKIELKCGIKLRLYSGITLLAEELGKDTASLSFRK